MTKNIKAKASKLRYWNYELDLVEGGRGDSEEKKLLEYVMRKY